MLFSVYKENQSYSPRRVCNPPYNKRVEILRNCEVEIKREQKIQDIHQDCTSLASNKKLGISRIEQINPSSLCQPLSLKMSPRRNHINNLINHNITDTISETPPLKLINKKPLTLNNKYIGKHFKTSLFCSESDSDENSRYNDTKPEKTLRFIKLLEEDIPKKQHSSATTKHYGSNNNKNIPKHSFSSFDTGIIGNEFGSCPQSEPLKRKIYSGRSSLERMKQNCSAELNGMYKYKLITFFLLGLSGEKTFKCEVLRNGHIL